MGKTKAILAALLVLALPFVFVGSAYAGNFRSGTHVTVAQDETIDHTLFVSGQNVEIDGTVKGDVFCAGENITVTGVVEGDVLCAGMNVTVSGTVMGDVRLAGQSVSLSGTVERNASIAGNLLAITTDAEVKGDLHAAGGSTTVNGTVGRDADLAGNDITINGPIGRDVQATTSNLRLSPDAAITGNLTYYSRDQLSRDASATVGGETTRKDPVKPAERQATNPLPGLIFSFLALLALAFTLLALAPRKLRALTDLALTRPGRTMLIGLAACIVVPILIIASFLTFVGFMVGIVLLLGWIIVMMVSGVLASYYIGRLILSQSATSPFVAMLTGAAAVSVLLAIPFVNIFAGVAVALLGSGMVVRELSRRMPRPTYEAVKRPSAKQR